MNPNDKLKTILSDRIEELAEGDYLYIPEFLVSFRNPEREILKQEIIRLNKDKTISLQRTSFIFMKNPKNGVSIAFCKDGSRNYKTILSIYVFDGSYYYSTFCKRYP